MKMKNNELAKYLNRGIKHIISDIIGNTLRNPRESRFLLAYKIAAKRAEKRRMDFEDKEKHIPAFLIASITNSCNLFCKGCYARENGLCCEENKRILLTDENWDEVFKQAADMGIGFILLAGGEPLTRFDVIKTAATFSDIIFPIFTNGTLINEDYVSLFNENRNLIPVISLEGSEKATDSRRGEGVFQQIMGKMSKLNEHGVLFGVSITVTTENFEEVTDAFYVEKLKNLGCYIIFYIEYVPVDASTKELAFTPRERGEFSFRTEILKKSFKSVLFVSFPGDEQEMGGCLAAGRGFFHINPYGDAEACPFSPYSDRNVLDHTLLEILQSPFFKKLQENQLVGGEHIGGCALFEQEEEVKKMFEK